MQHHLMIKMLLIAPFAKMAYDFMEVFKEHNSCSTKAEYEVEQYSLDYIIAPNADHVENFDLDAEVVISRGMTASGLRSRNFFIPLVEIPVAANDLIWALHKAKELCPGEIVAVTGAPNMIMGAEELASILGIQIKRYEVHSSQETELIAEAVYRDGLKVLIGGITTTDHANRRGLKTVLLESGRESIWHSLTEAKRLAYLMRREEEKTERLDTVLNHTEEAVIVLNPQGKIEVFNKSAERIFGLPNNSAIGKPIENIFPEYNLVRGSCKDNAVCTEVINNEKWSLSIFESELTLRGENIGSLITIQDITKIQQLETRIREKLHQQGHVAKHTFKDILGSSKTIQDAIMIAREYSRVDSTIIIIGKTGTGKEMFAQSIHNESMRKNGPFVAINCAALSEHLLETELFGYAEGAFTGAVKGGKPGLFEFAHHGTLFLDEISEIPPSLQVKLLRALQEKEIRRVGHDKIIPIDVRIITATNKNLYDLVMQGKFREDLFYRLNVLELYLPELKDRKEDIPLLLENWIYSYNRSNKAGKLSIKPEALAFLKSFDWPGNIRQLKNIAERLFVLYKNISIGVQEIEKILMTSTQFNSRQNILSQNERNARELLLAEKKSHDLQILMDALRKSDFQRGQAADYLHISRATLWRRMKKLGIE